MIRRKFSSIATLHNSIISKLYQKTLKSVPFSFPLYLFIFELQVFNKKTQYLNFFVIKRIFHIKNENNDNENVEQKSSIKITIKI